MDLSALFGAGSAQAGAEEIVAEPGYVADPEALWKQVDEYRRKAADARLPEEKWWLLCWRFFEGDQWIRWSGGSIIPVDIGEKPKLVINKIMSIVQTRRAHLLKNRPIGVVVPKSPDEEDRNSARVGTDVAESYHHSLGLEAIDDDTMLELEVTGNAFQKVYWDPTAGEDVEYERIQTDPESGSPVMSDPAPQMGPDGTPAMGPDGAPVMAEPQPVWENVKEPGGDVVVEMVPGEEILVDPAARRLPLARWVIHRVLKPKKYLQKLYGDKAENLRTLDPSSTAGSAALSGWKNFNGLRDSDDLVETLELWMKPDDDYPKGLHAVFADGTMLSGTETPKGHDFIPFVKFSEVQRKNIWAQSVVRHLLDVQKTLNLVASQNEYNRKMLRPRLIAPNEAGIDDNEWLNDDAEIPRYTSGYKPEFISPPALPSHHIEERDYLQSAADDIGGSQDILRGQAGSDTRSGRMVAYLGEYAGTVLGLVAKDYARGVQRRTNLILRLVKENVIETRIGKLVGRNRDVEVFDFLGSDLNGCGDYIIETDSITPMTQAERRDTIKDWTEKGLIPPEKGMRWMGMPTDMDEDAADDQLDRDNATQENRTFEGMKVEQLADVQKQLTAETAGQIDPMSGQPKQVTPEGILQTLTLEPRDFDNHDIHLKTHDRFRKGRKYRTMQKGLQALLDEHCDLHKQLLAQSMAPPPGAAPGGPPGGASGDPTVAPFNGSPTSLGGNGVPESAPETAAGLPPVPPVAGPKPGV